MELKFIIIKLLSTNIPLLRSSNLKPQTSNLKLQTSNPKFLITNSTIINT